MLCLGPGDEPGGDAQSVVEVAGGVVRAGRHLLLQLVQGVGEGLLQGGRRPQILKVLDKKVHQGYNWATSAVYVLQLFTDVYILKKVLF